MMFNNSDTEKAAEFANEFLRFYTEVGFGALSKREVDLLLLRLLQNYLPDFKSQSDFDAAMFLKTTKRKIRGLRNEISFREGTTETDLKNRLREHLKKAEILGSNNGMVMIQLDDAVLRGYAEKTVRSEFGIVDSSFNSSIMQLSGEKYLFLAYTVLSEPERKTVTDFIDKLSTKDRNASGHSKGTFAHFRDGFVLGVGNKAGQMFVSGGLALVSGGASLILEGGNVVSSAGRSLGDALKQISSNFLEKKKF